MSLNRIERYRLTRFPPPPVPRWGSPTDLLLKTGKREQVAQLLPGRGQADLFRDVLQTAIQVYATGFSTFCKGFAFYSEEDAHPHF
ncbi:MAG: hypothetical protein GVY04_03915 [Cyanobacteria bacterium]|nr:hypothetical protein [Cyanobacteria bacterium GSL.Bin1]